MQKTRDVAAFVLAVIATMQTAHAQTRTQTAFVQWPPGSGSRNGYGNAELPVRYSFGTCAGDLSIFYGFSRDAFRSTGSYSYGGKDYRVDAADGPELNSIAFGGTVYDRGSNWVTAFTDPYAVPKEVATGCLGQSKVLGPIGKFTNHKSSTKEFEVWINGLSLQVNSMSNPIRSAAAERKIRAQLAAEAKSAPTGIVIRETKPEPSSSTASPRSGGTTGSTRASASSGSRSGSASSTAADRQRAAADAAKKREADASSATAGEINSRIEAERVLLRWNVAEEAFRRTDYNTAQPIYLEFLNNTVFAATAQQRLDVIRANAYAEAAKVAVAAGEAVGRVASIVAADVSSDMDIIGVPRFDGSFFMVDGASKVRNSTEPGTATGFLFGWGYYRVFVLETRLGFTKLPAMLYDVEDDNWNTNAGTIAVQPSGPTLGFSGGFSLPFKRYVPYGTLGFDLMMAPGLSGQAGQYTMEKQFASLNVFKATFGMNYRLSESKGVGFAYTLSSVTPYSLDGIGVAGGAQASHDYIITQPVQASYKFRSLRVLFFWRLQSAKSD